MPPNRLCKRFLLCQILGDGADGRQPVPGHSDGAGPREAVLSALSNVVWHQTPPCCRHHSQGRHQLAVTTQTNARPVSRRGAVKPAVILDTEQECKGKRSDSALLDDEYSPTKPS